MKNPHKGYYRNGEYIPGKDEVVVDVVGVFTPPSSPRLKIQDLEENSNVDWVELLADFVQMPFFIARRLPGVQKLKFSLNKQIRKYGFDHWKVLLEVPAVFSGLKPKRYRVFRRVRNWTFLKKRGSFAVSYYRSLQKSSKFTRGVLTRYSRLWRFMERCGFLDLLPFLWYKQKGAFASFSRYVWSILQIKTFSFNTLSVLYIQQSAINAAFQGQDMLDSWQKENFFFTRALVGVKTKIRNSPWGIYWPSLKWSNRRWRVKPLLRRWPIWKRPVLFKQFNIGSWRLRRRYVSARWHYKIWLRWSWFKWVRTQSRQRWYQKKPLFRNLKITQLFFKDLFFLKAAERLGVVPRLLTVVNKPVVKSLVVFKKRKRSRKPRRFWGKLFGLWAAQKQDVVMRKLRRRRLKVRKIKFPKLVVVKKRGGLLCYPKKRIDFYKRKFSVLKIRRLHWLRKWTNPVGVRGFALKKRLLLRMVKNLAKSPRWFTKKGRFITLKKKLLQRPILFFYYSVSGFPVTRIKSGLPRWVIKKPVAPRWPRGFDRVRLNLKTVDCAVNYSKFLQYFLYNKYLLFLQNEATPSILPDGLVSLEDNHYYTAVFSDYLQLLHVHFFERVVAYYDRTSTLFYGAELLSKFIYISGQLLPWYLKYKARYYAWFLVNHNKRVFSRKKKYVYKLKILFDRLLVWLYRVEDIRYVWGFVAHRIRMAAAPEGGASFFYKKTLKIRFVSN